MSESYTTCVRGCVRYRAHLADCEDREQCRGCEPRRATYGRLCWPCHRRYERMLTEAPTVYAWLTARLGGSTGAARVRQDYERGTAEGSPAPISVGIFDARQHLADVLTEHVDELCERHGLHGPDRHTPAADADYLRQWLDRIEAFDWVGDWWDDLAEASSRAHALAPWRPEARRCRGIPCPECEETNLVIFGGEADVTCLSCRTMIPPERYGIWVRVLADEAREDAG